MRPAVLVVLCVSGRVNVRLRVFYFLLCMCVCGGGGGGGGVGVILFRLLLGSVSRTDPSVTNMNFGCFAI